MANIGYVGLGAMGSQMVDRLLEKGHTVTGYNRTRSKAQWLIDKGMKWADSPRAVCEAADVVISMVTNSDALNQIASGPNGMLQGLAAGKVWIEMSTVAPAVSVIPAGVLPVPSQVALVCVHPEGTVSDTA